MSLCARLLDVHVLPFLNQDLGCAEEALTKRVHPRAQFMPGHRRKANCCWQVELVWNGPLRVSASKYSISVDTGM